MKSTHYLISLSKSTVNVVLRTPTREGIIGTVMSRRGKWYTEPDAGHGIKSGPHASQAVAVKRLIDNETKKETRR